jgi:hypothetical protein
MFTTIYSREALARAEIEESPGGGGYCEGLLDASL